MKSAGRIASFLKTAAMLAGYGIAVLSPAYSTVIPDAKWTAMNPQGIAGVDGTVRAIAACKGWVYVGGTFKIAGNTYCKNIARWDGTSWSPLGAGFNGSVCALACDSSGNLYAGGSFDTAGGIKASRAAKWDGTSWSGLGVGIGGGYVTALALGPGGTVYAGGTFDSAGGNRVRNTAVWNGTAWSAIGTGCNALVTALAFDTKKNALYAGGVFDSAGGNPALRIALWDGVSWSALGEGIQNGTLGGVSALAVDDSGNCYAGGGMKKAGTVAASCIAKWNGTAWSALGAGVESGIHTDPWKKTRHTHPEAVYSLAIDKKGALYAGGSFDSAGNVYAVSVAQWNGSAWSAIGAAGPRAPVIAIAIDEKGLLYTGWSNPGEDFVEAGSIVAWDGTAWSFLGKGMNSNVNDLAFDDDGQLYIGGKFTVANGQAVNCIAKWDGNNLAPLGAGLDSPAVAMACDRKGNLYAGGFFGSAGGNTAHYFSRWNGGSWNTAGADRTDFVVAVDSDSSGNVFAVEYWNSLDGNGGGSSGNTISKWDGLTWTRIGGDSYNYPNIIACGVSGGLYRFQRHVSIVNNTSVIGANTVSQWNDTAWKNIGTVKNGEVRVIAGNDKGEIFFGGSFDTIGTTIAHHVVKWDGSAWRTLGKGTDGSVIALAPGKNGSVYASEFVGQNSYKITRWDGASWSVYDNPIDGIVVTMALADSLLVIAGKFYTVGSLFSPYIARLNIHTGLATPVADRGRPAAQSPLRYRLAKSTLSLINFMPNDRVRLYTLSGRCVRHFYGATKIDLSGLAPGIMIVRILRDGEVIAGGSVKVE
jgi:hypothetical protein